LHQPDTVARCRQDDNGVVRFFFKNDVLKLSLEFGNLLRGGHGKILLERKRQTTATKPGLPSAVTEGDSSKESPDVFL
jgi:hypothetical protein